MTPYVMSDQGGIFLLSATGEKIPLRNTGVCPSWTPNGQIIYGDGGQIFKMHPVASGIAQQVGDISKVGMQTVLRVQEESGVIVWMGSSPGSPTDVWIMSLATLEPKKLMQGGMQPSLSRDGKWVAYSYDAGDGWGRQIWRIDIASGHNERLTTNRDNPIWPNANAPAISPDGNWIACFSGQEATIPNPDPSTWGWRNVTIMPAARGPRTMLTRCMPASIMPRSPCCVADNPFWDGSERVGYDRASLIGPVMSGTWSVAVDGSGDERRIWDQVRGAGNVPIR